MLTEVWALERGDMVWGKSNDPERTQIQSATISDLATFLFLFGNIAKFPFRFSKKFMFGFWYKLSSEMLHAVIFSSENF